jgi:chemotaxis protein methyltransferase CheR
VFDRIAKDVLPSLAEENAHIGRPRLLAWSAGCAAGEEPYSLNLIWKFGLSARYPGLAFSIIATDADEFSLTRARMATYRANSLKELPARWIGAAFEREGALYRLKPEFQDSVEFRAEDLRSGIPRGPFDLVLCRNLAFTYFDPPNQRATALRLFDALRPGGALVVGRREKLPAPTGFVQWDGAYGIYRRPTAP